MQARDCISVENRTTALLFMSSCLICVMLVSLTINALREGLFGYLGDQNVILELASSV